MTNAIPVKDEDPRRQAVRAWIADHPDPSPRTLADAGLVAPQWPVPWGRDADPESQLIIEDELQRAGIAVPLNPNGILFTGPSLLLGGTPEQQARYLPPMLSGEELWCRLYSEPDVGTDLSAIRTRAERRGSVFVVNGWKLWAPLAQAAVLGGLLVRTNGQPGDRDGLSYLICPMDSPGLSVRPVRDLAGGYRFNELSFDNVEIPVANLVGEQDQGLAVAESRHHFERVSTARGAAFGNGPTARDLVEHCARRAGQVDPLVRPRLVEAYLDSEILRMMAISIAESRSLGRDTGLAERARKILLERHGRMLGMLACDVLGAGGMLVPGHAEAEEQLWHNAFLSGPSITIGAGTTEIQLEELGDSLLQV
ncbi:MAG TPA: acyl-CoA dehydrogenase family protein [Amycolatopsis sp.]|uniref:acyl-CoA dehydrogenase family protein n=1 Tax=Amycolatopsis sp. TaxID=37632 RepID=UPI002B481C6B|nr:acyl-CoA dehydrogenase family protein [Amycolatopsis sp.]HKS46995.1 acyl-CoA dehydrogenase family protein [Amycolatopsis sp.]